MQLKDFNQALCNSPAVSGLRLLNYTRSLDLMISEYALVKEPYLIQDSTQGLGTSNSKEIFF